MIGDSTTRKREKPPPGIGRASSAPSRLVSAEPSSGAPARRASRAARSRLVTEKEPFLTLTSGRSAGSALAAGGEKMPSGEAPAVPAAAGRAEKAGSCGSCAAATVALRASAAARADERTRFMAGISFRFTASVVCGRECPPH
jgi:hypothetical protein